MMYYGHETKERRNAFRKYSSHNLSNMHFSFLSNQDLYEKIKLDQKTIYLIL